MNADTLISREEFRKLAEVALGASKADHTFVSLNDAVGGTTRFANNEVTQNVFTRRQSLSVTVTFGQQSGTAGTTDLGEDAIKAAVARAAEVAKVTPADPEFLPPLPAQEYPVLVSARDDACQAGPQRLLRDVGEAIKLCEGESLQAAGIAEAYSSAVGVAASSGLFAYEPRTRAEFSLTATGSDSSGWVRNANRSIDDLDVLARTRTAIEKAKRSANPTGLPAGEYTVILEPAAVAGLFGPLTSAFDAKSYERGTSALTGKLGQRIIDERLSLRNRPDHPSLLGAAFNREGLPSDYQTWIERGVLKRLNYDRFTAKQKDVAPSFGLDACHLAGDGAAGETVDDLIGSTPRGVLVTNFWYIRFVNPTDLTLTGMTRDGTFLIEDGKIARGLINFRWHDSPLRALNALQAFTAPLDAITLERPKMLLPAMRIGEFNFSSVTKF